MINTYFISVTVKLIVILDAADVIAARCGGLDGYDVGKEANLANFPRVKQKLVAPPGVPEHSLTPPKRPRIVEVELIIEEEEKEIEPGVYYWFLTYNGHAPGPLIIVHEGDYVEVTLKNPKKNNRTHNVDFHASTGALGGGALTKVEPGQKTVLRFKAITPGVFIYHCAPGGAMIPWHVVHGMNGAMVVLPRKGLRDANGKLLTYNKAIYIGGQDFYIPKDADGNYKRVSDQLEMFREEIAAMKTLTPTHLPFGDKMHGLTGENALRFSVGDTIMIYHSQANRGQSVHLIGGRGDHVWERGNLGDNPTTNLETWYIASGSAGAAIYTFRQPGLYLYLSHNLIEAIHLGSIAHIKVDGLWNNDLMHVDGPLPYDE